MKKLKGRSEQLGLNGCSEVCRKCQKSSNVHNVKVNIWAYCRKVLSQCKIIQFSGYVIKRRLFSLAHLISICFINKQLCPKGNVLAPPHPDSILLSSFIKFSPSELNQS